MDRGKTKCRMLTECRKRIAEANHIPFEIEECTHQGDCAGTCPKCEAELRYLKDYLDKLKQDGKPVVDDLMLEEELCKANIDQFEEAHEFDVLEKAYLGAFYPGDEIVIDDSTASNIYAFAATITQQLLKKEKGNLIYSPAGLCHILEMLQAGMDDDSPIYDKVEELLNQYCDTLEIIEDENFHLEHASSLWYDSILGAIKADYREVSESVFAAEIHPADFAQIAETKQCMDKWVSDATHTLIKTLDTKISQDALMVVLDAIYLKAQWDQPFDPTLTDIDTFHNADDSETEVEMMYQNIEEAAYAETDAFQVMHLPYRYRDYCMVIVLPKAETSFDSIVGNKDWLECETEMREVDLYMPRFKFNNTLSFKEILTDLGLGDLFENEDALPNITDEPAHINQIQQQCVIQVEEEGTEAAAITFAECEAGCPPPDVIPQTVTMRLDRPFAFAIRSRFGQLLFMGVMKKME